MRTSTLLLAVLLFPCLAFSATLNVPGDYATIQEAIVAAQTDDVVLVSPGIYSENIDFLGKAITVKSAQGALLTLVNGGRLDSTVKFISGEGPGTVLEGFTITNGAADFGSGIRCENSSSPTINNNIITANVTDSAISVGGGIWCHNNSSPIITNNTISLNAAVLGGGGIFCDLGADPTIANNSIWSNAVEFNGGGISCDLASPTIVNNFIYANLVNGESGGGAGIYLVASQAMLTNNTICENQCLGTSSKGGGIRCDTLASIKVQNSILWNNSAAEGTEIYLDGFLLKPTLTIDSSDVENHANAVIAKSGSTLNWGPAMISADPAFLFPGPVVYNLHLTRTSPCINMGDDDTAPETDADGDGRPYMGTSDIGADEYTDAHSLACDIFTLSEFTGGELHFDLNAGLLNMGRKYLIFGSATGSVPGIPLPHGGKTLPINWDGVTDFLLSVAYLFPGFSGNLDFFGRAEATLNTFGPIPGAAGLVLTFAFPLQGPPWDFASNPIRVRIIP
ncbi:MAG: right-handed parallel beta-helix repeat-containing protein [Planctomycetota bacterium]